MGENYYNAILSFQRKVSYVINSPFGATFILTSRKVIANWLHDIVKERFKSLLPILSKNSSYRCFGQSQIMRTSSMFLSHSNRWHRCIEKVSLVNKCKSWKSWSIKWKEIVIQNEVQTFIHNTVGVLESPDLYVLWACYIYFRMCAFGGEIFIGSSSIEWIFLINFMVYFFWCWLCWKLFWGIFEHSFPYPFLYFLNRYANT